MIFSYTKSSGHNPPGQFLPGIFVWTLGPAFYQFLQMIEGVLRGATGGAGGLAP